MPDTFALLAEYKKEKCSEMLEYLWKHKLVSGVLLGGSISYKSDIDRSDVDLFCLINHVEHFEGELITNMHSISDVDAIICQGSFPWTGKLYTIYYKKDGDFCIDLCLIDITNAETFFWEPNGYILFDKSQLIDKFRTGQIGTPGYTRHPFLKTNPFSLSVITLKKIDKNLSRGHLWNALEQLNILRRYIMQIIRLEEIKHFRFLGRVDRDFEDVIPTEINLKLSQTVAIYDPNDIALKTVLLIDMLGTLKDHLKNGREQLFQDWIVHQLKHHKDRLMHSYKDAQT